MRLPIGYERQFAIVALIAALMSCGRGADRAANDTGAGRDTLRADTLVAAPVFREWMVAAGRHLLVASESGESAVVVFPEFTVDSSLATARFTMGGGSQLEYELFAPDGSVSLGRLAGLTRMGRPGCDAWPRAVIAQISEPRPWTIGLNAGRAHGLAYAALDALAARDSANVVVQLTRLASVAPNDTSSTLRGLPYVVRSAFTATIADSQAFVLGELVRRVNIEASPHEERTTIIGERSASASTPYNLAFSERHVGDEESVPTTELIGLITLRGGTPVAFAVREYSDGGTFLMFVRSGAARWQLRWQSAYAGC